MKQTVTLAHYFGYTGADTAYHFAIENDGEPGPTN